MAKQTRILLLFLLLTILLLFVIYQNTVKNDDNKFKIYFFNAGKADAILLSKNKKYFMIDTGEASLGNEILSYLKSNHIDKLEYLIVTHFDKDHVGSASQIINNIEIGKVLQSNVPKDSEFYDNYIAALNKKSIEPVIVNGDYKLSFDDLGIIVNGPSKIYDKNESNNASLIVKVINGDNKFLFMGDSENDRIRDFLTSNNETYDFIKMPYHCRYLKELDNLLASINAKYAVMTCSYNEGCEEDTISLLNKHNISYYATKKGSITILSDGRTIKIKQ